MKARSQASLPADSLRATANGSEQAQTRKHEHRSRSDRSPWRAVCRRGLPARREARARHRFGCSRSTRSPTLSREVRSACACEAVRDEGVERAAARAVLTKPFRERVSASFVIEREARVSSRRPARGCDSLTESACAGCAPRITERETMRRVARELKFHRATRANIVPVAC